MQNEFGSTSINTGIPPARIIEEAHETQVNEGTPTLVSFFIPNAFKATINAPVPCETIKQYFLSNVLANNSSHFNLYWFLFSPQLVLRESIPFSIAKVSIKG